MGQQFGNSFATSAMNGRNRMAALPDRVKYLVIGAGVHGLSTAWHLAKEQRSRGEEPDVLIVDKAGIGAGASGIACGV
ncbi:MAG TPA: FAD-dependent oxidoreductase, partial [Pedococcus sp.]|nr:FAD-dependent oxidoreductase [Pedococcus sp.]